jgi:hypothetical protein
VKRGKGLQEEKGSLVAEVERAHTATTAAEAAAAEATAALEVAVEEQAKAAEAMEGLEVELMLAKQEASAASQVGAGAEAEEAVRASAEVRDSALWSVGPEVARLGSTSSSWVPPPAPTGSKSSAV